MTTTFRAQFIATALLANTERHLSGLLGRDAWSKEQRRLWTMAEKSSRLKSLVLALVAPRFGR